MRLATAFLAFGAWSSAALAQAPAPFVQSNQSAIGTGQVAKTNKANVFLKSQTIGTLNGTQSLIVPNGSLSHPGISIGGNGTGGNIVGWWNSSGQMALALEGAQAIYFGGTNTFINPIIVGSTSQTVRKTINNTASPQLQAQVNSATVGTNGIAAFSYQASTTVPAFFTMAQSNSNTVGTQTATTSGSLLGQVDFEGSDGTNFQQSSEIIGSVGGAVSSNIVPGDLKFQTANTSGTLTTAMEINDAQGVFMPGLATGVGTNYLCAGAGNTLTIDTSCTPTALATGANPTATITTSIQNGSAATFMRSDAAPAAAVATNAALGYAEAGTGLLVSSGVFTPDFGTATNKVAEGGVITAGGPTGSSTVVPVITYNAAGQLTAVTTATIADTVATGVTAAGTNQGTATALTNVQNIIATAASGTGVVMQAGVAGGHEYICNYGANTINIYPASGAQINALGTNAAIGEPTGTCAIFISVTTTQWYSVP